MCGIRAVPRKRMRGRCGNSKIRPYHPLSQCHSSLAPFPGRRLLRPRHKLPLQCDPPLVIGVRARLGPALDAAIGRVTSFPRLISLQSHAKILHHQISKSFPKRSIDANRIFAHQVRQLQIHLLQIAVSFFPEIVDMPVHILFTNQRRNVVQMLRLVPDMIPFMIIAQIANP